MKLYKLLLLIVLIEAQPLVVLSQSMEDRLRYIGGDENLLARMDVQYPGLVKQFYSGNHYRLAWINDRNRLQRDTLVNLLASAEGFGLFKDDYQVSFFRNYQQQKPMTVEDSVKADILFTDAALHFFRDMAFGNKSPQLGYYQFPVTYPADGLLSLLHDHLQKNTLSLLPNDLDKGLPEIKAILTGLRHMQAVMNKSDFTEVVVTEKNSTVLNKGLIKKLYQLGMVDTGVTINDSILKQKVKEAQHLFGLMSDGIIRSTLLQELNVTLQKRVDELRAALNNYRWLNSFIQQQKAIVVNIPVAFLKVYEKDSVLLQMKLIVGKKTTPTPTLLSVVDEVVLYPYWHVPYSIATKELLPHIKRNIGFLDQGNYQVLNLQGKIVDPYKINWQKLSLGHFPYIIRQGTGCDNSLGLLKLNFYSPFGVYLHDTPSAALFGTNKRFYSHGCMRMEKPFELGHLLLKDNSIAIDTLEEKGCLLNQAPVIVKVREKIPVLVWYNTVAVDAAGRLVFHEDVYERFRQKK